MTLDRRTVNFAPGEASILDRYKEPESPEHVALTLAAPGERLDSDSNVIKALVRIGHQHLQELAMQAAYDRAVDSGEFDAESRAAMARSRKDVASMATEE